MSFIALWSQNGSFQTPQSCQFLSWSLFQNRHRKVFNRGLFVSAGGLWVCAVGAWHSKNWQKLNWFIVFHLSVWGGMELCLGAKPPNPPRGDGTALFRSSPMVMNVGKWLKEYYLKCKRQRWCFYEEFTVWHFATKCVAVKFVKLWMSSSHLPQSREIPATLFRPCVSQNTSGNIGESCYTAYTHGNAAQRSSEGPGGVTTSPTLLGASPTLVWNRQNYLRLLLTVSRRGFTIRLKRLKPRAPDFEGLQKFGSNANFQHFCK